MRDYLVRMGVPATAIDTVSYGDEQPAVEGRGEAVWTKNRRAELEPGAAPLAGRR